jgi:redox-sensing transcriptional repressor
MNDNRQIKAQDFLPEPTLRRLPWYLAYVTMLQVDNVEYVSSTRISEELKVDASQIAKDLSFLNIKGKTRIGYEVNKLVEVLRDFLGFDCTHKAVMVGVGSLGAALMQDTGLMRYGLKIVAGVDINPDIIGKSINGITITHTDSLQSLIKQQGISIGIIAVPVECAQVVANNMMDAGIKALWNFTPYRIHAREGVVITNTSIYSHLAVMYNRINSQNG